MKQIFDYVVHLNHFIPKDTCDEIIQRSSQKTFERTSYYDIQGNPKYKDDKMHYQLNSISISELIDPYIPRLLHRYELRNRNSLIPWTSLSWSVINFLRYTHEQRFERHVDHTNTIFDGERRGIPTLTIIGWLNDDYEGGEFYVCDNKIDSKPGDVIMFPSNFLYPHEVKSVLSGVRYSWVTWVY